MSRAGLTWLILILLAAPQLRAELLRVPDDFTTIQDAINSASEGDRIEIAPGHYTEALSLKGGITIAGTGFEPEDVVLEGEGQARIGTLLDDPRLLVLENLLLREGFAIHGAGLYLENARIRLDRVHFWGCGSMLEGGAIFARNVDFEATFCIFYLNYSWGTDGAACYFEGTGPLAEGQRLENCTFAGTSLCCGNASIYIRHCGPEFNNCILEKLRCGEGALPVLRCNAGDFCGIDAGGHIFGDPLFCDLEGGNLHLQDNSRCLPQNSGDCGLIGALGACNDDSPVEEISFSHLKTLY